MIKPASSNLTPLILAVFTLIIVGFLSKRLKLLEKQDAQVLNKAIIYLTLPAMIFQAVRSSHLSLVVLKVPLVAVISGLLTMSLAFVLARFMRLSKKTFGAFVTAAAVGNTGYLGYPLTQEIFGNSGLVKAVFYDLFGTVLLLFTVGIAIAEAYSQNEIRINRLKEVITFPPLIALLVGYLSRYLNLPVFTLKAISFLGQGTLPLIMISIGLSLELGNFRNYLLPLTGIIIIKLALLPSIVIFLGKSLVRLSPHSLGVSLLESSMPIALLTLIIGLKFRLDTDFLSTAILLTTAISLITIPLWQYLGPRFFF